MNDIYWVLGTALLVVGLVVYLYVRSKKGPGA